MKPSDSHFSYAKALYKTASRLGVEENVLKQLESLKQLFGNKEFLGLIKRVTFLEPEEGKKILGEVFEKYLEKITFHLLILLFLNRKLVLIPKINQVYRKIYHQEKGIADITLVTAKKLSSEEAAALEELLSQKKTMPISVTFESNPSIIGGVQYYEEGYLTDFSIKNYLQVLKKHLISNENN